MPKITLPNGSDTLPLSDIYSQIKKNKVEVSWITLMALVSDLHYLRGYCESLQWSVEYWKDRARDKDRDS